MNATFAPRAFPAGRIGFSSQSGALGLALLETRRGARARPLRRSSRSGTRPTCRPTIYSSGGRTTPVPTSSPLPRVIRQPTQVRAHRPQAGASEAGSGDEERPLRAGQKAAGSHTAALAGSDTAVDAVFNQAGVIRADTLSNCSTSPLCSRASRFRAADASPCSRMPAGSGFSARTRARSRGSSSGARRGDPRLRSPPRSGRGLGREPRRPARLCHGRELRAGAPPAPRRSRDRRRHRALRARRPPSKRHDVGAAISRATAAANQPDKPVLAAILSAGGAPTTLRSAGPDPGVPVSRGSRSRSRARGRLRALAPALRRHRPGARPDRPCRCHCRDRRDALADRDEAWLDPSATRLLLEAYGLPIVGEAVAASVDEAVAAAGDLGYPVVVKSAAAGAHKTETGGVALDLADAGDVRVAVERIGCPVIVQPMVKGGVELLAGVAQDPRLRSARRIRPRRSVRRADRRCAVPALAAHGHRRRRARRVRVRRDGSSRASAALRQPTPPLWPMSSTACRGSLTTSRAGRARPQSRDRRSPTGPSSWMRAFASRDRTSAPSAKSW